jgi:tetratricopeptide (TPR) repeat protein
MTQGKRHARATRASAMSDASGSDSSQIVYGTAALIAVLTFLLYLPALRNRFIFGYGDDRYLIDNGVVPGGLIFGGIKWAFTATHFASWLPITWLSHMLDVSLFGMNAVGHHATSAVIHAFNAGLLFLCLARLTTRFWPSVVAAALFAAHPLRVESVAWIAERKDVLCALFFLLAVLAYARYVSTKSILAYLAIVVFHALGLMSGTMIVTLPAVLLLLDFWPLKRVSRKSIGRILLEKVPLLILSGIAGAWTIILQRRGETIGYEASLSLTLEQRLANAAVSIPRYLGKTLLPIDLAVLYPHPGNWPGWAIAASVALIVAIFAICILLRRRSPYLLMGWLWFLVMLLPVSGIVAQDGQQSIADRHMYLPGIGLLIGVVWLMADLLKPRTTSSSRPVAAWGSAIVVGAIFTVLTVIQERYWVDRFTLFSHAAEVTDGNWLAESFVATGYLERGDLASAEEHARREIAIRPDFPDAHINLAVILARKLQLEQAIAEVERALALDSNHVRALTMQGQLLLDTNHAPDAIAPLLKAISLNPDWNEPRWILASAYTSMDRHEDAAATLREALNREPNNDNGHYRLASALRRANQLAEAMDEYRATLRLNPLHAQAAHSLGTLYFLQGDTKSAIQAFQVSVNAAPNWIDARVSLGEALLKGHRVDQALQQARIALQMDGNNRRARALADRIR